MSCGRLPTWDFCDGCNSVTPPSVRGPSDLLQRSTRSSRSDARVLSPMTQACAFNGNYSTKCSPTLDLFVTSHDDSASGGDIPLPPAVGSFRTPLPLRRGAAPSTPLQLSNPSPLLLDTPRSLSSRPIHSPDASQPLRRSQRSSALRTTRLSQASAGTVASPSVVTGSQWERVDRTLRRMR